MLELRTVSKVRGGLLLAILVPGVPAAVPKSLGLAFAIFLLLIACWSIDLFAWRCPACGKHLGRDVSKYCIRCGEKLDI